MFGPSKATRDAEFTAFVASAQQPLLRMAYALTGEAEAARAALPEQQSKVVVLRHYADMSEAHVADTLGISRAAVKSAASRGLAALRQHASRTEEGLLR